MKTFGRGQKRKHKIGGAYFAHRWPDVEKHRPCWKETKSTSARANPCWDWSGFQAAPVGLWFTWNPVSPSVALALSHDALSAISLCDLAGGVKPKQGEMHPPALSHPKREQKQKKTIWVNGLHPVCWDEETKSPSSTSSISFTVPSFTKLHIFNVWLYLFSVSVVCINTTTITLKKLCEIGTNHTCDYSDLLKWGSVVKGKMRPSQDKMQFSFP